MIREGIRALFAGGRWVYIAACFLTFVVFDILWAAETTFRCFGLPVVYFTDILAALLLVLPYLLTRKNWLQLAAMLIVDIWLMANLMYCRTYFTSIPADSYFMASNLADFLPSVADSMRVADFLLPLITVVAGCVAARFRRRDHSRHRAIAAWSVSVALAMVGWIACVMANHGFAAYYGKIKEACYYSTCTTPMFTPAGDLIYEALNSSGQLTDADREMIESWFAAHDTLLADGRRDSVESALPQGLHRVDTLTRRNIVVILCESLESWVVGQQVDGVELTPVLNTLIADSTTLYAPHVLTQVGNGRSIDCQLLVNAGMLPMEKSVYSMTHPRNFYPTINRAMARRDGARSMILSCDKPVTWNQLPISRAFGVDTLLDKSAWRNDELVGNPAKLSDGSFMLQIAEKLDSDSELWPVGTPAYVEIITYSGHNPFRLPDKLKTVSFSNEYPEKMRNYMEMAHYTDASLAPLIAYLQSRPDYAETLVVITGDHEGLAKSRDEIRRNRLAADVVSPMQFTPFIVLNAPVGGLFTPLMGQIDIYPTLMEMMQLSDYKWRGMGQSILDADKKGIAVNGLTGELSGDTVGLSPSLRRHMLDARRVSDRIIEFNLLSPDEY